MPAVAEVVVDTNVLYVAEGLHHDVSPACVLSCVQRLQSVMRNCTVVVDDRFRVLNEYQHKLDAKRGKGPGAVFLKWLSQNLRNGRYVAQVAITDAPDGCFAEFPVAALQKEFDPSDRKFAAIANAHAAKPPILQATDSKWLMWKTQLAAEGITVEFLCPDDICGFFKAKFPGEDIPALP